MGCINGSSRFITCGIPASVYIATMNVRGSKRRRGRLSVCWVNIVYERGHTHCSAISLPLFVSRNKEEITSRKRSRSSFLYSTLWRRPPGAMQREKEGERNELKRSIQLDSIVHVYGWRIEGTSRITCFPFKSRRAHTQQMLATTNRQEG